MEEQIRFCRAPDGTRIAYATCGAGPGLALVRTATWLTHLVYDGDFYRHWLEELAPGRTLVRYDLRGCGLSDRDVGDVSLEAKVSDLAAVVDAAQLDRFDLLGLSGGGAVAIAYAARHPERVAHLVLYGSYALGLGRQNGQTSLQEEELLVALTRVGWDRANPAFRRVFTLLFRPDATDDEVLGYEEMQLLSCSPEVAARIREASYETDVVHVARRISVPTLVMHVRDDAIAPFEEGRRLAALIRDSRFLPLPGRNHILGPRDAAWRPFVDELLRFLDTGTAARPDRRMRSLTARERAVLELAADGLGNELIAERLCLSVRTVERHLSNVYAKLGVSGKAARAAAAAAFARLG